MNWEGDMAPGLDKFNMMWETLQRVDTKTDAIQLKMDAIRNDMVTQQQCARRHAVPSWVPITVSVGSLVCTAVLVIATLIRLNTG